MSSRGQLRGGLLPRRCGQREFLAFWGQDRALVAGMDVNVRDVTDAIQTLVSSRLADMAKLGDVDVPLTEVYLHAPGRSRPTA